MATQNEEPPEPSKDLSANPQAEPPSEPEALCFGQAFATSANLVFGESGPRTWARDVTALQLAAALPPPTAQLHFIPPARASLQGALPDLRVQDWGLRSATPL